MSSESPAEELKDRSCPHCGAQVPALPECFRCGIVFAKYRPSPRPTSTIEVTASRPDSRPLAPWLAVLGLVIVLAVVSSQRGDEPQPTAIPPQTVASQPVSESAHEPASPADVWNQDDDFGVEAEPDPETHTASAADYEASASVDYDWFADARGYRSGIDLALAESKPIAVYFYTDWCGYCRQFERELLTSATVEDFTKYLVKVRINPESGLQEREIARQYGVRGYPSFFVHASANATPRKVRRHRRVGGDWVLQTPHDFVTTLRRAVG